MQPQKKIENISDKSQELRETIHDIAEETAQKVEKNAQNVSQVSKEYVNLLEQYAYRHPLRIISSSIVFGAVVALLVLGIRSK